MMDYYFALPCYGCTEDEFYHGDAATHTAQCFDWAETRGDIDIPAHCSILFMSESPINGCMTTVACSTCPVGYRSNTDVLFGLERSMYGKLLSKDLWELICEFACVKSSEK